MQSITVSLIERLAANTCLPRQGTSLRITTPGAVGAASQQVNRRFRLYSVYNLQ